MSGPRWFFGTSAAFSRGSFDSARWYSAVPLLTMWGWWDRRERHGVAGAFSAFFRGTSTPKVTESAKTVPKVPRTIPPIPVGPHTFKHPRGVPLTPRGPRSSKKRGRHRCPNGPKGAPPTRRISSPHSPETGGEGLMIRGHTGSSRLQIMH